MAIPLFATKLKNDIVATLAADPTLQGPQGEPGIDGAGSWGMIAGTLADQVDLNAELISAKDRLNHTGTQSVSTISDFPEGVDDRVASLLVAGANVSLTYDDVVGSLTITAAGGGGGGVSDGDKGDITVSGVGTVYTIDAGAVTLAKMADMATGSVFYRKTAGTGAPEVQTLATLKTDLGLTGTNSGDQTTITGNAGTATALATGRTLGITGDLVWTSPSFNGTANVTAAGTLGAGVVTNAKLANVSTATLKGRSTAGTGSPEDLTATQVRTLLNVANGATANTGTVTSVSATVPTGFSISGSPITSTGTLAITFTAGYALPTTAKQTQWDTAYSQTLQWNGGATNLVAATGRTSLGATTVGGNLFTLANPSAITFPRINADNTISALSASAFLTAIGSGLTTNTLTINNSTQTDIALGDGVLVFLRNETHGGVALILYENASTPVIISQSGPTTFQTTTPSGSAQIQVSNRSGNLGISALASTDRNGASLSMVYFAT